MATATLKIRKTHEQSEHYYSHPVGESRAKQSMADECDINKIMKKLDKNGILEHVSAITAQYLDVSNPMDYQEAMQVVIGASEMFLGLPAAIRASFDNDAATFLNFIEDPANEDAAIEMGLLPAKPVPPAEPPPVEPPPEP